MHVDVVGRRAGDEVSGIHDNGYRRARVVIADGLSSVRRCGCKHVCHRIAYGKTLRTASEYGEACGEVSNWRFVTYLAVPLFVNSLNINIFHGDIICKSRGDNVSMENVTSKAVAKQSVRFQQRQAHVRL